MSGTATSDLVRPRHGTANAEARAELLEALIGVADLRECAELALHWLSAHAGSPRAVCALIDDAARTLVGVAAHGVKPAPQAFTVDLEERAHPLARAIAATEPTPFASGSKLFPRGAFAGPLVAFPLRARHGGDAIGLLVAAPGSSRATRWGAAVLGEKLALLHARERLAQAERRFERERTLLDHTLNAVTDPILLTDTDGSLIIANLRAERLFAAPDDASEGRRRAVSLNNMLFSAALSSHAVGSAEMSRRELLLVDPMDGSDLLFELLSSVVREAREGTCVVSILRNVTDLGRARAEIEENYRKLRLAEAEARAERHRLELIIDSVADPILVTDPAGDIVLMNPPAEKLFTVAPDAGEQEQRRVQTNDAHFSSFVSSLFSGSEMRHRGELGLIDPQTGNPFPTEAISGKVLSESGELTAVVTILHDRTEAIEKAKLFDQVKQASVELEHKVRAATGELAKQNELLRRQAIALEQASTAKSQFLANMSHEFRTPLNAILGYTNMLLQGVAGPIPPPVERNLVRVDSNARHLLAIVNDILDITRIEAGRMPLRLETMKLADLLGEVVSELEPIISAKPFPVRVDMMPKFPTLRTDRQKVKQIILNFLSNALKFTHQGSITIRAAARRGTAQISVADTGIGIAPADQAKIFEDFQQADSSPTRAYGGAGLGLSICRRLATMLGGNITIGSAVGVGSTFSLHIPVKPGEDVRKRRIA